MLDDKTSQAGNATKRPSLLKKCLAALQPPAVVTGVVLVWYLIITRGPLAFLWLFLVLALGYVTVRRWGSGYSPSWIHWMLAFSIVGSAVYGFCQLNAANTRTRHADIVYCDADRDNTQWSGSEATWKIETQRDDYFVEGGTYQGRLSDANGAVDGFTRGRLYRITFHGGYMSDRYMTAAELLPGTGSCGEHD